MLDVCDESPNDLLREKIDWEIGMKALLVAGMMDTLFRKEEYCAVIRRLGRCVSLV